MTATWIWDKDTGNFGPIFVNVFIGLIPAVYLVIVAICGRIVWRDRWKDPLEALETVYGELGPVRRVHITNWITWQEVISVVFSLLCILTFLFTMLLLQVEGRPAPTSDRWHSFGSLLLCIDACFLIAFQRSVRMCPKRGDARKTPLKLIQFFWLLIMGVAGVRVAWAVLEMDVREYHEKWAAIWNIVWIIEPSVYILCGIAGLILYGRRNFSRDDVWGTLRQTFLDVDIPRQPGETDDEAVRRLTTAEPRKETPEFSAGLWKTMSFQWLNPLIRLGNQRLYQYDDFFDCMPDEHPAVLFARFDKLWRQRVASGPIKRWSLANVVYKFTLPATNISALYKFTYDTLLMIAPLFLQLVVDYLTDRADGKPIATRWRGLIYVGLMALNGVMQTILLHQYFHNQYQLGLQIRSALSTAVYEKSLRLDRTKANTTTEEDFSSGKVINLMAVDAQRVSDLMAYIHIFWSAPYQIIVTCALLWFQIRWAAFAGLGVMLISLPLTKSIITRVRRHYQSLLQEKDRRIKKTTETLNGIRAVKYYVWEEARLGTINEIRDVELGHLKRVQSINILNRTLMYGIPSLVAIASFAVYTLAMGEALTPATAFTALALFNNLRFPLIVLPNIINSITESAVTIERMQNFLLLPSLPPKEFVPYESGKPALEIKDLTVQINPTTVLVDRLSLTIKKREMVVIVGRTGAGKTAFISTLLGDLAAGSGQMNIRGSMAYCSQTAWIQTGTVQENIIFGSIYNEARYNRVVRACALEDDFRIFPDGDQTEIGERGINLSGGQKQRIALARAVYRESDIYIFDDVLSAVDTHVAEHITREVFLGLLKDKAILLITHRFEVLDHATSILFLHDHTVDTFSTVAEASTNELFTDLAAESLRKVEEAEEKDLEEREQQMSPRGERSGSKDATPMARTPASRASHISPGPLIDMPVPNAPRTEPGVPPDLAGSTSFLDQRKVGGAAEIDEESDVDEEAVPASAHRSSRAYSVARSLSAISKRTLSRKRSKGSSVLASPVAVGEPVVEEGGKRNRVILVEEERMAIGKVGRAIYAKYFRAWGLGTWSMTFWVILTLTLSQGIQVGSNFWLSFWSGHAEPKEEGTYISSEWGIGGYTLFNVASVAFIALTGWLLLVGTLRASRMFHANLLNRTMKATLSFFDSTPIGRMLSRFAKDINSIDDALPATLYQYMNNLVQIIAVIIVIAIVLPWMIIAIVPMIGLYLWIEKYYVNVVRQFRRIESTLRAPVISNFAESFEGATIIRAFREIGAFRLQHMDKLNANLVAIYISNAANRWLAFRLESLGTLLVVCTALVAVLTAGSLSAALGGLALSYAISCTNGLNWLVRMSGDREANIVSVERLLEYDQDEHCPQEQYESHLGVVEETAPGQLEFQRICLQYRPGLPYALKNVSFIVRPGEKVGVVGRTGAGKSSLLVALLRLTVPQEGHIVLNGVETTPMSVTELRSKISIIPQDSILFSGTLRSNLDPFSDKNDEQLWETLRRACLGDWAKGLAEGLEYPISENGSNLSNGQKQLLCLARVLLKDNRFLLLDEATSAVDPQTDALIQHTIRTEFRQCTILTIAHRIRTVIDYDKIIVMADGRVAEYASPKELLADPKSIFAGMVKAAE